MKNKGIYLLLFLAVILGGSFFILNLRDYWRGVKFSGGEKSFLLEHEREEFKDEVKASPDSRASAKGEISPPSSSGRRSSPLGVRLGEPKVRREAEGLMTDGGKEWGIAGGGVNVKNEEYYINLFGGKNLFKVLGKEKSSFIVEEEAAVDLGNELSKFELLGIVSSGGTAKALIKDASNGKTFYGAVGENLDGFSIKEIMSDKIILEREGKTFELRL